MADYIITDKQLSDIADGARNVLQTTDTMSVAEIATNLKAVQIEDSLTAFLEGTLTELVSDKITKMKAYAFSLKDSTDTTEKFTRVYLPNLAEIGYHGMSVQCTGDFNIGEKITTLSNDALSAVKLDTATSLSFPALATMGTYVFSYAKLPALETLELAGDTIPDGTFSRASLTALTSDSLNALCSKNIGDYAFSHTSIATDITKIKLKGAELGNNSFAINQDMKYWLDATKLTTIGAATTIYYEAPFFNYGDNEVEIYTNAETKPDGWSDYFNCTNFNTQATVHYGVTEEEFDAL